MADPWDEFAARIDAPEGTNIYPALAEQIIPPAIVIAPDEPWIQTNGYQYDIERYLAICLVESSSPADGLDKLHRLVHAVRDAGGDDGWEIGEASGVRSTTLPDDGTRYLGSWVRVSFRNCEHEVEEGS